jgi:hypothetical protein
MTIKSTLPVWDTEPLVHIFGVSTSDYIQHQLTFQAGYIAALRTQMATTEECEEQWRRQAMQVFDVLLKCSDENSPKKADMELKNAELEETRECCNSGFFEEHEEHCMAKFEE